MQKIVSKFKHAHTCLCILTSFLCAIDHVHFTRYMDMLSVLYSVNTAALLAALQCYHPLTIDDLHIPVLSV